MNRLKSNLNHIQAELLLSFIILVLLTAAAIGLPSIWLISDQLNHQAWTQVDQGSQAAYALYQARQSELDNLATLTAERPTLRRLLAQNNPAELSAYLQTLQAGAQLDLVQVCGPDGQRLGQAGAPINEALCSAEPRPGFQILTTAGDIRPEVWLLAAQPLTLDTAPGGQVIVGLHLNHAFAAQMRAQTGLEHTLLVHNRPTASSLPAEMAAQIPPHLANPPAGLPLPADLPAEAAARRGAFNLSDQSYYTLRLLPAGSTQPDLTAEMALPVADISAARQRLAWILIGGIAVVTALGSLLGLILTRRIRRPLAALTQAATRLSQGDLHSPVSVNTHIHEIARVADALEAARLDLQATLNDLQREKAWSSHLLEAIVEGIVTLDAPGRIAFFSQGAERITGWSREQVIGRPADEIFRLVDSDLPFSQLLPTLTRRAKLTMNLANKRQATLSLTGASLAPEGHPAQTALVFRDVSEEEVMHRLVGQFLANIAHEFRTPLSALAASVELLLDQTPDLTQAELRELLNSLYLGVLGLQTLIDNLLESASIEAGRFHVSPRPTALADIISEVSRTLQPLLSRRGQTLRVNLPPDLPPVQADPRRTVQVLTNLLSNASKYSPDATEINLTALAEGNEVRLTIADQGPGIPPELRHDLFRRLMHDRGSSDDRLAQGGAGLGLSVVKAVVEAQNGQVGVDDRPGGGAIFWFTLPQNPAQ